MNQPENLLLNKERHLKLIDFATGMVYDETKVNSEKLGKLKIAKQDEAKD